MGPSTRATRGPSRRAVAKRVPAKGKDREVARAYPRVSAINKQLGQIPSAGASTKPRAPHPIGLRAQPPRPTKPGAVPESWRAFEPDPARNAANLRQARQLLPMGPRVAHLGTFEAEPPAKAPPSGDRSVPASCSPAPAGGELPGAPPPSAGPAPRRAATAKTSSSGR
jgi:hypothetical protein